MSGMSIASHGRVGKTSGMSIGSLGRLYKAIVTIPEVVVVGIAEIMKLVSRVKMVMGIESEIRT